jgi:hypothetical protein
MGLFIVTFEEPDHDTAQIVCKLDAECCPGSVKVVQQKNHASNIVTGKFRCLRRTKPAPLFDKSGLLEPLLN